MEDEGRTFETIKINMASVETGMERFSARDNAPYPLPAFWRVNLTALSQKYNLYFIAMGNDVQLYEPQFPFQKLGGAPKTTLSPQLANSQAPGYINPRRPHHINNLIVGQLGEQEILLLSTDSGNVIGYETRALFSAMKRNSADAVPRTATTYIDVRPFFTQWVVESAWGLAIHQRGRMIAVSANASPRHSAVTTHGWEDKASVTIFAFALTVNTYYDMPEDGGSSPMDEEDISTEWDTWDSSSKKTEALFPSRHKNYKIILAGSDGHPTNVPHVAFFNSPEDQNGAWLLSTDVAENVKMWQIWSGKCIKTWEFRDFIVSGAAWLGGEERGWLAVPLDEQAFQPVSDMDSLIGHHRAPPYHGYEAQGESLDITHIVHHYVPSNGHNHPLNESDDDSDSSSDTDSIRITEDMSDFASTADVMDFTRPQRARSEFDHVVSSWTDSPGNNEYGAASLDEHMINHLQDDEDFSDEFSDEEPFEVQSDFSEGDMSGNNGHNESKFQHESPRPMSSPRYDDESAQNTIETQSSPEIFTEILHEDGRTRSDLGREQHPDTRIHSSEQTRSPTVPNVPFLYCSSSHLRLFNSTDAKSPHLFCARFLKQAISSRMEEQGIAQMDRLDMIEQIPELGIVIIATQFGRCAICSLTKREADGMHALRVDWVLPTIKQERAGLRPHMPLHGLAVSPVQKRASNQFADDSSLTADHWTRDRLISGVATMFDKTTIDMSDVDQHASDNKENDQNHHNPTKSTVKMPRLVNGVPVREYDWSKQNVPETRKAMLDGKRHYRLMMTYADMTVLTYEISRGVERSNIRID